MSAREQINLKSLDIYIEGPSDQHLKPLSMQKLNHMTMLWEIANVST